MVEEDVSTLQANDVLGRGFEIVNRHVGGADHLDFDQIATNGRNEFGDVVGGYHHGAQRRCILVEIEVIGSNTARKAGKDHHQAGDKGALRLSAHALSSHINYLIKTNN